MSSTKPVKLHPVSVFIPVLNEADKIAAAVQSVAWADEIVVIDTGCTDDTVAIARELGCRIETLTFEGFGKLRNDAVALCTHDWVLSIDADERCTPALQTEILAALEGGPEFDLYYIPRRNYFMGREIRHCGWYPDYCQPKLFKKGALIYRDDMVHEGFDIHGRLGYLKSDVLHFSFRDLDQIIHKMNRYSTLGMQKMLQQGKTSGMGKALLRGLWAFFRIYVLKLGFLDGWPGFVIALGNFEGTYYRYAKLALAAGQAGAREKAR
ncbi:MAG: alpha-L-glycero-D-manno-heptose beta-1,4-glucosyltransferase [Zetaproteobacteria bacterium CG06_land_8_20_14_3_00_59_53]|nr:MAG: alpha-L-glycero-D-manno-heptose beta-1,4-glucosyltransferase [Zetaproteobacteria bacterium CG2_30_59_37]PIO88763.1 MAG: alpha-L-glycero-D-manno-heptose beta-1,4-glucosyltransferase [Zetaproteobacteria bacterium CG23_combo_of_CG06-09_8_20_14_all_59_86]PIQ65438.1 MAG: alpha-L-glycero-D-manno-heptose beta-1,4-glucosyltransferase [Zetaproteobacteria bacterium CG11_big_fil_rev_8_21_14_0_20_59_439]PIU69690.1 MAG: alpha-L-glycero-D-manno-heptose beta-1,4-glucosyltransferase [Zetaproteobacteria 